MSSTRPQPVLNNAKISAAFTAVVGLAVTFGVVPVTAKTAVISAGNVTIAAVLAIIPAVGTIVTALRARNGVTPISAPQSASGDTLVATDHDAALSSLIDELHSLAGGGAPDYADDADEPSGNDGSDTSDAKTYGTDDFDGAGAPDDTSSLVEFAG